MIKNADTYHTAMEFLGLEQRVTFPTHNKGHTLDHVLTESSDKMIVACKPGIYISDHRSVMAEFNIPKRMPHKSLEHRGS